MCSAHFVHAVADLYAILSVISCFVSVVLMSASPSIPAAAYSPLSFLAPATEPVRVVSFEAVNGNLIGTAAVIRWLLEQGTAQEQQLHAKGGHMMYGAGTRNDAEMCTLDHTYHTLQQTQTKSSQRG